MVVNLVNLNRYQRACDDDGEPLSPALQEPQANALGQEESSVDKANQSEFLDSVWRDVRGFMNQEIDVMAAWVEAEHRDPMVQLSCYVLVNQLQYADADHDEGGRLEELEYRDQANQQVLGVAHGKR